MAQLVEDAGEVLSAGLLSRVVRMMRVERGVDPVGGRAVEWELVGNTVAVAHRPARRNGKIQRYAVGLLFTRLPPGGSRWWWACPACQARVDALYLPPGRDRLGCRTCCGLAYVSQYPNEKRRKPPAAVVTTRRRVWTPATGWRVLSRRKRRA